MFREEVVLMPLTVRQQIIEKVKLRLAQIAKANNYQTDSGQTIYYGRLQAPSPQDLPAINIWDAEEVAAPNYGRYSRAFSLFIELYMRSPDLAFPEMGNIAKADLEYAILRKHDNQNIIDDTFDSMLHEIQFVRSELFLLESTELIGGIMFEYKIFYMQAKANPYLVV